MSGDFKGKVALVTGGGSGIGRAACLAFAAGGAAIAVADRAEAAVVETLALITAQGGQGCVITADVADEASVNAMVDSCLSRLGRLDCAFNNAGISGAEVNAAGRSLADIEKAGWDKVIAINLTGVWLCMKAELAVMKETGGSIVNTASIAGLVGLAGAGAYTVSKHGVVALTKVASTEYAGSGVRVNAVCPGYITTPLTQSAISLIEDKITRRFPAGRFGEVNEIAELVVWLASDRASFVNGAAYTIDGGYTAAF